MEELMEAIEEAAASSEFDLEYDATYSGRSMYGETCASVSSDLSPASMMLELCQHLDSSQIEELALAGVRSDNMGLGSVIYFPGVTA